MQETLPACPPPPPQGSLLHSKKLFLSTKRPSAGVKLTALLFTPGAPEIEAKENSGKPHTQPHLLMVSAHCCLRFGGGGGGGSTDISLSLTTGFLSPQKLMYYILTTADINTKFAFKQAYQFKDYSSNYASIFKNSGKSMQKF